MTELEAVRRWLYRSLAGIAAVLSLAIAVLAREEGFDLYRAAITVLLLFGAGEVAGFEVPALPRATQALVVFTAYSGALGMALLLGAVVDLVFRSRLPMLNERKGRKMKDHVILCGLGHVGYRTLLELEKLEVPTIVIEKDQGSDFAYYVRERKIPIVFDDVRNNEALRRAGVAAARAVIAATNDDLANIEVALDAREMNPNIRVVMRLFDQRLAEKVKNSFQVHSALSSSALAAPRFAIAAVDPDVESTFYVGDRLFACAKIAVTRATPPLGELEAACAVTILRVDEAGRTEWTPAKDRPVGPGATLHAVAALPGLVRLRGAVGGPTT